MLLKFHHEIMIPMALQPGYPEDTADKALHITIAYWLDEAGESLRVRGCLLPRSLDFSLTFRSCFYSCSLLHEAEELHRSVF